MKALPVIARELRAQARQATTYNLRMLSVAALLAMAFASSLSGGFQAGEGGSLFSALHLVLFWAIWILVPLSTSDCLSRERREDTLGLLFLTPLRARDIVLAKALAHGWRALTLWLAALPILVLPFLVGGLPWQDVVLSCAINFSSIVLALGASVLASSVCRQWHRALVLTMALVVGLVFVLGPALSRRMFAGTLFSSFIPHLLPTAARFQNLPYYASPYYAPMVVQTVSGGWQLVTARAGPPRPGLGGVTLMRLRVVITAAKAMLWSLAVACGLMLLAAWNVRGRWQHRGRSARAEKMERLFCTPIVLRSVLSRWMRRSLARNPIGWLERRRWNGRVVTWAWLAVVMCVYSAALADANFFGRSSAFQHVAAWLVMGSLASSAAGSFRRERESGVLELMLVAPLTTGQIIWGRLRGLWGQFLLAVALLLGLWLYISLLPYTAAHQDLPAIGFFALAFLTVPVIGLYFSLRCQHYVTAFLLTLTCGLLLPHVAGLWGIRGWSLSGLVYPGYSYGVDNHPYAASYLVQMMAAGFLGARLRRRLELRAFPFNRAQM